MSKRLIERHLQNRISKLNVIRIIHKKRASFPSWPFGVKVKTIV